MSNKSLLLTPLRLDSYTLPNRMVMAPHDPQPGKPGGVPTDLNVKYYTQRVSAGLVITEGVHVPPQAIGGPPGSPDRVEGQ